WALTTCPNYHTAMGSGCTAGGGTLWLSDNDCRLDAGDTQGWTGTLAMISSPGVAACGTFPAPSSAGTLDLQWVTAVSSTTPSSVTITNISPVPTKIVDDATANLANFNGDTIAAFI